MTLQAVARIGDHCTLNCAIHGQVDGQFTEGSPICTVDGIDVVLVGHHGLATCGHHFVATTGSGIMSVGTIPVVRVTDQVQFTDTTGTGVVVSGSPDISSY